jgi:hypothetical protein
MLGGASGAIVVLLLNMPEGIKSVQYFYSHTPMPFFINGTKPEASLWQNIKAVLGADYTIWAAFLGSTSPLWPPTA